METDIPFLFLSFYLSIAAAQVIIKEKIEIDGLPQNKVTNKTLGINSDSLESYLIMPKRGMLKARIWGIQHLDVPLPDYSTFNVHFIKGDSTKTDSLINSIPLSFDSLYEWLNFCGPPPVLNRMWYSYYSDPDYELDLGGVNEGDTVQFIYHSDNVNTGEPTDYGYLSAELRGQASWYMIIGSYDDCIWDYDNAVHLYIEIWPWDRLYVNITPGNLYPGDTANVVIKKRLFDGTLVDFDTSQTFEIAKLEGCIWGNILVEDSLNSYFYGALQPIKFVVDTSIAVIDSLASSNGIVKLGVGVIVPNKKEQLNNPVSSDFTDCFVGPSITNLSPTYTEIDNALKIISPINEDIKWITKVPEMPPINCEAIFKPLYPWPIKFEWEFQISKEYQRRSPEHSYICERISRSKFRGLSYSEHGGDFTNWLVPFDKDSGTFHFESLQPSKNKYDPLNYIYGCNGETDEWYDENEDIFTGGEIKISLVAKDNQTNKILGKIKELPSGLILGENPDPAQIDNYIVDDIIKAIQLYESHNFQFEYDKDKSWPFNQEGWPIYGEPNGYGLMQLDNSPAATERQLWNWKANIDGAKYKFYTLIKSNNTDKFLDKHPDTVTEEMRLRCAYQKYNFFGWDDGKKFEHYYYKWDGKKWVVDEYITKIQKKYDQVYVWEKYGDGVYNIYTGLNQ